MERKDFLQAGLTAGAILGTPYVSSFESASSEQAGKEAASFEEDVIIERPKEGKPHEGKVLAAIQPHSDDIPLFAGGTVAKLLNEGYKGYLIRTSNDDAAGGGNYAERVHNNYRGNELVAEAFGMKGVYNLNYRNHRFDEQNIQDLKQRLIFLFRLLKVDTVVSYDPLAHYEENPDHYVTAKAVEAARWMAGMSTDYPEQLEVVEPHGVSERYYFARGLQPVNRVVDISESLDTKIETNQVNVFQGPGGNAGYNLKKRLKEKGKRLPILGDRKETANYNYIKKFMLDIASEELRGVPSDKVIGEKYGLEWAERFRYMGPGPEEDTLDKYINENAVSI